MKLRYMDMINEYINYEKERTAKEIEKRKRPLLEKFGFFIDERKKKLWHIKDITGKDAKEFYIKLKKEQGDEITTERKIQTLNHFMDFAISKEWIKERAWEKLFETEVKQEKHFRISEETRKKLIKYFIDFEALTFMEKRDRSMFLILLNYKLRKTEISKLNINNYKNKNLEVITPFAWRNREIKLKDYEVNFLEDYLNDRVSKNEAENEEALFVGFTRRRIEPGMIKKILTRYIFKFEESKNENNRNIDK